MAKGEPQTNAWLEWWQKPPQGIVAATVIKYITSEN